MSADDQELRALAFLALRIRRATSGAGPWDEDGLMTNLRKIQNRNLHMLVEHTIRHAADPAAKTPGVLQGTFTPEAPVPDNRARPPKRAEQCPRCGGFRGSCACQHEHRADDEDLPPMPPVEPTLRGAELVRAAMNAVKAEESA